MYGIEATGQTSSAKVSYHIRLSTPVLFPISLSSVYTGVILSNRNAEQSHIPVTRAFIPAKPAPQLSNSDGSITLKYPKNGLFGFPVAPLVFVGITIIVSAVSQFCACSAKMTNTFWHRSGFSKAFVMLLLVAQTALFVPGVRLVASERVVLSQVPQAVATRSTLFCPTSTSAQSGGKITVQFPMGRYGDGPMARCGMKYGPQTSGSDLGRSGNGEKAQKAVNLPVDGAIPANIMDGGLTQFSMLIPFTKQYYGGSFCTIGATCNSKNHIELHFSNGKHAPRTKNHGSETLWMILCIGSIFSETCLKFVNFACVGSNLSLSPSLRFISDRFNDMFCISTLVYTINIGLPCAQHLDDSDRPATAWTVPTPLVAVMHNGIIFQAPVACVPPHVFIGLSGMCIMGSISAVILIISPSDCIAGKTNAPLAMTFFPVTSAILSGGTIITMYPTNFFASSVAHVVSAGATSVPALNGARKTPRSTAVVLTTSGATINASVAAFIIQKPASRSNLVFLTGIGLSLLAAGFCAQFISLPRATLRLSAVVYLTVRAPLSA